MTTTKDTGFAIENLRELNDGGWAWTVRWSDANDADDVAHGDPFKHDNVRHYHTNSQYQGLWIRSSAGEWQQVLGTCQFELTQATRGGVRRAIVRHFERDLA